MLGYGCLLWLQIHLFIPACWICWGQLFLWLWRRKPVWGASSYIATSATLVFRWQTGLATRFSSLKRTLPAASGSAVSPWEALRWNWVTDRYGGYNGSCLGLNICTQGKPAVVINRPLRCDNCCVCPCLTQEMTVECPAGSPAGSVEQCISLFTPTYIIKDREGEDKFVIEVGAGLLS